MATAAAYVGATFSAVISVAAVAGVVFFATKGMWIGVASMGALGAIGVGMICSDWANVWKPLFSKL